MTSLQGQRAVQERYSFRKRLQEGKMKDFAWKKRNERQTKAKAKVKEAFDGNRDTGSDLTYHSLWIPIALLGIVFILMSV
jgi:hypothetical protein